MWELEANLQQTASLDLDLAKDREMSEQQVDASQRVERKPSATPRGSRKSMEPKEALQPSRNMPDKSAMLPTVEQDDDSRQEPPVSPFALVGDAAGTSFNRRMEGGHGMFGNANFDAAEESDQELGEKTSSPSIAVEHGFAANEMASYAPSTYATMREKDQSDLLCDGFLDPSTEATAQRNATTSRRSSILEDDSCIDLIERYVGPEFSRDSYIETVWQTTEYSGKPIRAHNLIHQKRNLDNEDVDLLDRVEVVEYDPTVWELRDGRLRTYKRAAAMFGPVRFYSDQAYQPLYAAKASSGEAVGIERSRRSSQDNATDIRQPRQEAQPQPARRSRRRLSKDAESEVGIEGLRHASQGFHTTFRQSRQEAQPVRRRSRDSNRASFGAPPSSPAKEVRIGRNYQATIVDDRSMNDAAMYSSARRDIGGGAEKIWDPRLADEARARGEDIDRFIRRGDELNITMLLMEALHRSNYNVNAAMREFIDLFGQMPDVSVNLTDAQKVTFDQLCKENILSEKKDFAAAAKRMGCRKEIILVNYYRWKASKGANVLYERMKRKRKKEPNECVVCDDGGVLIVCDLCNKAYHFACLRPPLQEAPDGLWCCPTCEQRSPAKVRRHSGFHKLDTSPRKGTPTSDRSPALKSRVVRRLSTESVSSKRRASLRSVHKELSSVIMRSQEREVVNSNSTNGAGAKPKVAMHFPSGMIWDAARGFWVRGNCSESPVRSDSSTGKDYGGSVARTEDSMEVDEDPLLSSPKNGESDDEDSRSDNPQVKDVISIASSSDADRDDDSSFHEEDADDVSDDGEYPDGDHGRNANGPKPPRLQPPNGPDSSLNSGVIYNARIPITPEGLLINIAYDVARGAFFSGYRKPASGGESAAERKGAFMAVGDVILQVDGFNCAGKTFAEVKALLTHVDLGQREKVMKMRHPVDGSDSNLNAGTTYDTRIAITPEGLGINITDEGARGVVFSGYTKSASGGVGAAEKRRAFTAKGDAILQVDGMTCVGKSFAEVKALLKHANPGQREKVLKMRHPGIIYDARIPFTAKGLVISISHAGAQGVVVSGYKEPTSGVVGAGERSRTFMADGDTILQVDGVSCVGKKFEEVKDLLTQANPGQSYKVLKMRHAINHSAITGPPRGRTDSRSAGNPVSTSGRMGNPRTGNHTGISVRQVTSMQQPRHTTHHVAASQHGQVISRRDLSVAPGYQYNQVHLYANHNGRYLPGCLPGQGNPAHSSNPASQDRRVSQESHPALRADTGTTPLAADADNESETRPPAQSGGQITGSTSQPGVNLPAVRLGSSVAQHQSVALATQRPDQAQANNNGSQLYVPRNFSATRPVAQHTQTPMANARAPDFFSQSLSGSQPQHRLVPQNMLQPSFAVSTTTTDNGTITLSVPGLLAFLRTRGIERVEAFLAANISVLATEWAKERNVPFDVALEFIGATRLHVRQHHQQASPR